MRVDHANVMNSQITRRYAFRDGKNTSYIAIMHLITKLQGIFGRVVLNEGFLKFELFLFVQEKSKLDRFFLKKKQELTLRKMVKTHCAG